jgi:hypothetical protein
VIQKKTGPPVLFEITEQPRASIRDVEGRTPEWELLVPEPFQASPLKPNDPTLPVAIDPSEKCQ